jgi:xanthine dehydrogenase YagT iron-sulfur-binding subunit
LAVQYENREITTIEGVDDRLQAAFVHHDGFQCGYCTSGQICSALGMLAEHRAGMPSAVTERVAANPTLTTDEIRERMSGNLCRCGAYNGIVAAIEETAR